MVRVPLKMGRSATRPRGIVREFAVSGEWSGGIDTGSTPTFARDCSRDDANPVSFHWRGMSLCLQTPINPHYRLALHSCHVSPPLIFHLATPNSGHPEFRSVNACKSLYNTRWVYVNYLTDISLLTKL